MTLHNFWSRQFHRTSNEVNPCSAFRLDMHSARPGPHWHQSWRQSYWPMGPRGANDHGVTQLQVQIIQYDLYRKNSPRGFRDMLSPKSGTSHRLYHNYQNRPCLHQPEEWSGCWMMFHQLPYYMGVGQTSFNSRFTLLAGARPMNTRRCHNYPPARRAGG